MAHELFFSTFVLIFLSELPDKTNFASFLLAARNNPWAVFLGACGAFVVQSAIAVAFGGVLTRFPHWLVHDIAGLLFLAFGLMMWLRKDQESDEADGESGKINNSSFLKTAFSAFMVIFVAEWGDLTQLATATLEAKYNAPLVIFTAATLALWCVTGLGVAAGHRSKKMLNPDVMKKCAAGAFFTIGALFLTGVLK